METPDLGRVRSQIGRGTRAIRSITCSKCDLCSTAVWWLQQDGSGCHPLRVTAADELLELFSALESKNYIGC